MQCSPQLTNFVAPFSYITLQLVFSTEPRRMECLTERMQRLRCNRDFLSVIESNCLPSFDLGARDGVSQKPLTRRSRPGSKWSASLLPSQLCSLSSPCAVHSSPAAHDSQNLLVGILCMGLTGAGGTFSQIYNSTKSYPGTGVRLSNQAQTVLFIMLPTSSSLKSSGDHT